MTDNNRVTNRELGRRLDELTEAVKDLEELLIKVPVLAVEVEHLKKDVNNWKVVNSMGVVGAAILGFFFGPRN